MKTEVRNCCLGVQVIAGDNHVNVFKPYNYVKWAAKPQGNTEARFFLTKLGAIAWAKSYLASV